MKKLFRPYYILLFVSLPQLLLLGYLHMTMDHVPGQITVLMIGAFVSALLYAILKRKEEWLCTKFLIVIAVYYGLLLAYGFSLLGESSSVNGVSPRLVFVSVCMITVLYGVFGIIYITTANQKGQNITGYVVGSIVVPQVWFIAANVMGGSNLNTSLYSFIIATLCTVILLTVKLGLLKGLKRPITPMSEYPTKKYLVMTTILMLLLPLGGLTVNQIAGRWDNGVGAIGLFGDFSHPIYYVIAIVNALLLLIPHAEDRRLRLLLFYLKSAGYAYILYFFVIFLPVLPLGAIGIIFYGLGILVWAPLMAAIWQGIHLVREWKVLTKVWGAQRIILIFLVGMITIPGCLTLSFSGDKANFNTALQYLHQQPQGDHQRVNLGRLKRTLKHMQGDLQPSRDFVALSNGNTPILSAFYSQYVLNGRVISEDNVMALDNLFFDTGHQLIENNVSDPQFMNNRVKLKDVISETLFDEDNKIYRTWIHIKLENPTDVGNGEYITTFKLPTGVYVSDYYLDVFGLRKTGILTDRRAALFIYRKIVNTRQDPGLLHYIGKNTLELRVFPFAPYEERETGFEIIHTQPFELELDLMRLTIEGGEATKEIVVDGGLLLSSEQKKGLQPANRAPKYYFIIDTSKNSDINWHLSQLDIFAKAKGITEAEVIFTSYDLKFHTLKDMRQQHYQPDHGFNLGLALRSILISEAENAYPIIIAVSDNVPAAVYPQNIYPLADRYPETAHYYALNHNLTLTPYAYEDNRSGDPVKNPVVNPVLSYDGYYIPENDEMELVLTTSSKNEFAPSGNQYRDAVQLEVLQRKHLMLANTTSVDMVRASFRTRILTAQTAFIVVETTQQEKELFDLQERFLSNNLETPVVTLDEPSLLLCMFIFILLVVWSMIGRRVRKTSID